MEKGQEWDSEVAHVQHVHHVYTCKPNLFVAEQAEDAVVELHVSAVVLVHLSQDSHQLCTGLSGMGALALMRWQLMERTLPRAADPLVLALRHPGNIMASLSYKTKLGEGETWRYII